MLSYKKHYPPCPPRQRRTSVARKNSGDYRMDCSPSAPSMRFSALSLSLFVGEELAPPVAPNTPIPTTIAKSQPPLAQHHVLASPRKRVRFCCSVKPSQLWWGLLPIRTINEIFRTIPLAFRKLTSVCTYMLTHPHYPTRFS